MEEWITIAGFPHYQVSSFGRVKSLPRSAMRKGHKMKVSGKILKPGKGKRGHLYVNVRHNNKATSLYVHRIVATAFLGNPPETLNQVAHWDGNPENNNIKNLRWTNQRGNSEDSIRHNTSCRPSNRGEGHPRAKLNRQIIEDAKERAMNGESFRRIARSYGVTHLTISNAVKGVSY